MRCPRPTPRRFDACVPRPFVRCPPTPTASCARSRLPRPAVAATGAIHKSEPKRFNEAREVADRFKEGTAVIMNLQSTDDSIARRLVDFASGLVYGLDGKIELVANRVYLLTPGRRRGVRRGARAARRRRVLQPVLNPVPPDPSGDLAAGGAAGLLASAPDDRGFPRRTTALRRPDGLLDRTAGPGDHELGRAGRRAPPRHGSAPVGIRALVRRHRAGPASRYAGSSRRQVCSTCRS